VEAGSKAGDAKSSAVLVSSHSGPPVSPTSERRIEVCGFELPRKKGIFCLENMFCVLVSLNIEHIFFSVKNEYPKKHPFGKRKQRSGQMHTALFSCRNA
jgi:hypothetical protein